MRLAVISHTPHHHAGGRLVGWGPTIREIDHLAGLFEEVVHIAPVHDGPAPASGLPYRAANVRVVAVPPAGGESVGNKLDVLRVLPRYVQAIRKELARCDIVHVRCPSNIGLVAALLLSFRRLPEQRWIKYAGNWRPRSTESWSYGLQRWLLSRRIPRALVTVNGRWPDQPAHVRSFLNPCLTDEELREGAAAGAGKSLVAPARLLFVGRLDEAKGCGRAVGILEALEREGIGATLDVVGDGPDRGRFETQAKAAGVEARFHGWLPRPQLSGFYANAHFLLLPSTSSEGWPKVLSEAMAYGVLPIASDVSSVPQYVERFGAGRAIAAEDRNGFVRAIAEYVGNPERWKVESRAAMEAASLFVYGSYLEAVRGLLDLEAA